MAGSYSNISLTLLTLTLAPDWPKPIELNATLSIVLEQLAFLGDTQSRRELLVFAQANPARLPLAMGILQPDIPVRRMANERKTKLTDALVQILRRLLTTATVTLPGFQLSQQAAQDPQTAGVSDIHAWGRMLPSSSRVSPITYHSVVAVRYPDLCRFINSAWELGSFASGGLPSRPQDSNSCSGTSMPESTDWSR